MIEVEDEEEAICLFTHTDFDWKWMDGCMHVPANLTHLFIWNYLQCLKISFKFKVEWMSTNSCLLAVFSLGVTNLETSNSTSTKSWLLSIKLPLIDKNSLCTSTIELRTKEWCLLIKSPLHQSQTSSHVGHRTQPTTYEVMSCFFFIPLFPLLNNFHSCCSRWKKPKLSTNICMISSTWMTLLLHTSIW